MSDLASLASSFPSLPLALTCGDPAGIGPEVILRGLSADEAQGAGTVLLGPAAWCEEVRAGAPRAEVRPLGPDGFAAVPGQPTEEGAQLAWDALEAAARGCRAGQYGGVVTGSVSKAWLERAGFPFPGQTEFFAARWGGEPSMGFVGGGLRVVLATWHIPLAEVPEALTRPILERAVRRAAGLAQALGVEEPRIAVCGLNPHAGEEGLLGTDERDRLDPILDRLRKALPGLTPCLPADTLFWRARQGEFDAIVALYHDQGLAPLKAVAFDEAVNVTLGLPWVRTSPDHGTAFGLAGANQANPRSWVEALRLARLLVGRKEGAHS